LSPVTLFRPGEDHHRCRTVDSGTREQHDSRGPDQLSAPAVVRGLLVAGAMVVGALWIVLASLPPAHRRGRRGAWALHRASRLLLRALGIGLTQRAAPRSGASLVVANDVSWLDVLVLSAAGPVLPVVNAEVARWPLLGSLARRSGAIFIDRKRPSGLRDEVQQIATAMRRGHRVLVFPAAGGARESAPNPFRRAAFQAAVDAAVVVSPVAVSYRGSSRLPVTLGAPGNRATLIRILAHRDTAEVNWLPVIPAIVDGGHPAGDRARAAAAAQRAIARALQQPAVNQSTVRNPAGGPTAGQTAEFGDKTPEVAPTPKAA
jgi:1-acyl-sn-glycerol-3-phosphate acyltransferase